MGLTVPYTGTRGGGGKIFVSQTSTNDPCNLERFSFDCRKTKPKVITLANHKRCKQRKANASNPCSTWDLNICEQVTIGFGFASHWLKKWCEFR